MSYLDTIKKLNVLQIALRDQDISNERNELIELRARCHL